MSRGGATSAGARRAWETRKRALGTIYAIATEDGGRVKIGFTTNLRSRRTQLLSHASYFGKLTQMVACAFGTFEDEQRLHRAIWGQSFRKTRKGSGPRELYPMSVLTHPACRDIFGPAPKGRRAA